MKRLLGTSVAVGVLLAVAPLNGGEEVTKELMKLEGKYSLVRGDTDGKPVPEKDLKTALLVIVGNKHTVQVGDTKIVGTHKVDPTGRPKTIDAMDTEGPFKGGTALGIYELKGDTFAVCFAPPGKARPQHFTTKTGTGVIHHVWKRMK